MENKSQHWIFLRGLSRGNIHWSRFPEVFQSLNQQSKIEFLEIPGNGFLFDKKTPIDPIVVINLMREKSQLCQTNSKFNLCGISLGGMIALKWAEIFPAEIESVAIINSSLNATSPFYQRLMPHTYSSIIRAALSNSARVQETLILEMTSNKFDRTQTNLEEFSVFAQNHPVSVKNLIRQLILAQKIKINQLPDIPLKVIWSEKDRLVSSHCSQNIAKKFDASCFTHPTAGHDLPLDEPEWLTQILSK